MHVTLLSTDVRPRSGWGTITHELALALAQRTDVSLQILLPRSLAGNHELAAYPDARPILPAWRASFGRRWDRNLACLFPRVRMAPTHVIHTLVEFSYAILASRLARRTRTPFVVSTHGTHAVLPFRRRLDAMAWRRVLVEAAAVTAPSHFTAQAIRALSGVERPIHVVPNPVEVGRFRRAVNPRDVRQSRGLPAHGRVILSVGALKQRKGFDVLIRAFVRVAREEPAALLVIAGDGPVEVFRDQACRAGIGDRVRFLGSVADATLVELYHVAEIFALLPCRHDWHFEGFGLVYLEAGACGTPVVATRSGGVPEAVRDGETGLLVQEDDPEEAAAALLRLLRNPPLARALGEAGRRWAARHDRTCFAERIHGIYQQALERQGQQQTTAGQHLL